MNPLPADEPKPGVIDGEAEGVATGRLKATGRIAVAATEAVPPNEICATGLAAGRTIESGRITDPLAAALPGSTATGRATELEVDTTETGLIVGGSTGTVRTVAGFSSLHFVVGMAFSLLRSFMPGN